MTLEERFWAKVHPEPNTGCWLWGANLASGYGRIYVGGKPVAWAHRVAWEYAHGPIPEGLRVIHRCLIRACVNPAHLFLGTRQDVQENTCRKGRERHALGTEQGAALLTDTTALEVRRRWAEGERTCDLARAYSVSPQTIYACTRGYTWKHLPVTPRKGKEIPEETPAPTHG